MQTIETLKAQGREKDIEAVVKEMRMKRRVDIPRDFAYVEGRPFDDYIHDMKIVQIFVSLI